MESDQVPVIDAEARRKGSNLLRAAGATVVIDIVFGVYFVATGQLPIVATILLANAACQTGNYLWYLRERDVEAALMRLTYGGIATLGGLHFVSFGGTGIYYVAIFPSVSFLLQGYRRGLVLNAVFFGLFLVIISAKAFGLVDTPYGLHQHVQSLIVSLFVATVAFFGQRAQEDFRRQLVAQRERLDVILRGLPVGVLVFDAPSGRMSVSNDTAATLLGKPIPPAVTAETFARTFDLKKEDGAALSDVDLPAMAALRDRRMRAMDLYIGPQDRRRVLSSVGAPVIGADGRVASAVLVLEDYTKRYEVDKMKSEFVSLASHQLKTPLSAISWALESVLEDDPGLPPVSEDRRMMLDSAYAAVKQMNVLVSDLLNVSRIETGRKFDLHPTLLDGAKVLRECAAALGGLAAQRGITFDLSGLPKEAVAMMDEGKIREVFTNLVSNAVKYSRDGGAVKIGAVRDTEDVTFYVADEGLGIPTAARDRIFTKFYRAPNVIEGIEGTGLGLYIVKAIVEKHGGKVAFESEEGKGTTFTVRIPVALAKG